MEKEYKKLDRLLWVITIVLVIIGIAIVYRRLVFIGDLYNNAGQSPVIQKSKSPVPDNGFANHPLLTLIHIIPGLIFMLLAPIQLSKKIRSKYPAIHRNAGRVFLICSVIIGLTALVMGFIMPIGGVTETLAVVVFGGLFLFAQAKAFIHIKKREIGLHREWMIRVLAIGLAISTTRPIVVMFFATSNSTKLSVHDYFGVAFWIAFTIHLTFAEIWIRYTKQPNRVTIKSQMF